MKGALLVMMPFVGASYPALGLSLLKAALVREGLPCAVQYLNLRFAARIGPWYDRISHKFAGEGPHLLGEWLFAADLFGDRIPPPERYLAEVLHRPDDEPVEEQWPNQFGADSDPELIALRAQVAPFLDECVAALPWDTYGLVGFSTTFQQNTASLALAQRLKAAYPHLVVVFGGGNCDGEMGVALHRLFPFVDYVCSGEGDLAFPLLARRVLAGEPVAEIAGITRRVDGRTVAPRQANAPVVDMDALPVPDYDDFLQQWAAVDLQPKEEPRVLIETSRGCWWGQKSHCTFCGLNDATIRYRAKSPGRALAELAELTDRYQPRYVDVVDNIIDLRYFRDVLPRLAEMQLDVELFYETKANLRKEQVRLLGEAGILMVQPGIESLSTNVLRLMRKGVSALQNVQLLRWCTEYVVWPQWSLLAGFPGEDPADYARQAEIVPLLTHLPRPAGLRRVRLDRFSPLFENAEAMGIRNVRAAGAYRYVYPFAPEDLAALAYYFDFDYADGRDPKSYLDPLEREVERWTSLVNRSQLTSLIDGDALLIYDTRSVAVQPEHELRGLHRAVYEHCDKAHTRAEIATHLATLRPEPPATTELDAVLAELLAAKLTLHEDGRYLSLAVPAEYQLRYLARRRAAGRPLSAPMQLALARLLDPRAPALTVRFAAELAACGSPTAAAPLRKSPEPARLTLLAREG